MSQKSTKIIVNFVLLIEYLLSKKRNQSKRFLGFVLLDYC
jgi:hypothetical protein